MFMWGESLTETTPAVNTGQILLDKTTSTLHVDTDAGRTQIVDNTKLPLTGGTMIGDIDFHDTLSGIKFSVGTGQYSSSAGIHLTSTTPLDTALTIEYDSGITSITMDQNIVDILVGPQPNGRSRLVLSDGNYGAPSATFSSYAAGSNDPQPLKVTGIAIPTNSNDATNKQYVDGLYQNLESEIVTTAAQYLPLKGGTMTGSIDMRDYRITSLATPSDNTDAANKEYVDDKVASISTSNSNLLFATTSSNPDGTESPARLKLSIPRYTGGQAPASGTYLWVLSTNGFNASIAPGFEINDSGSVITVDYTTNTGAMPLKAPNTMALFSSNGTSLKLIGTIFQIDEGTLS